MCAQPASRTPRSSNWDVSVIRIEHHRPGPRAMICQSAVTHKIHNAPTQRVRALGLFRDRAGDHAGTDRMAEVVSALAELELTIADLRQACVDESFTREELRRALTELHDIVRDFRSWTERQATSERN